jgi:hypothetical protein
MREKGWSRAFDDPIGLPDGSELTTLREAIAYLGMTVPKVEQSMPEVLTAAEILTRAAERGIAWCFWRASQRCGRSNATKRRCSIPIAKTRIGESENASPLLSLTQPRHSEVRDRYVFLTLIFAISQPE